MKADLTRLTFDPAKHYRGVHQQQGRVQLDSDWNEQAALVSHRIETETLDTVGHCGAPMHDDGFKLVPGASPGELLITPGRFYAGGVLVINESSVPVTAQPELPGPAEFAKTGLLAAHAPVLPASPGRSYLAYLDVWPRHRTAIEDASLREVALGGPDTATRTKNTWQVKFLPFPANTPAPTCATPLAAWDKLVKPALGTLSAEILKAGSTDSPCIVEPGSGYRRLENQLYRVEVHQAGDTLAQATFKWSRDNGSVAVKWKNKLAGSLDLTIENTGRDKVLGLSENQWVELTDDTREELGVPGVFVQIARVEGDTVTLRNDTPGFDLAAIEFAKFPRHPKLRRWEGLPATVPGQWLGPGSKNAKPLDTQPGDIGLFELEDGLAVRFGEGVFRTGDHWLIPARTARTQLDWPTVTVNNVVTPAKLPPHGVPHHYCKLAVVTVPSGNGAPVISDCRPLFPPLTELTSFHYVGGDAQSATPNPAQPAATLLAPLPLPLEVGVANGEHPVAGARIRFTVTSGNGALTGAGLDANGIIATGPDGVARVSWALRNADPVGAQPPGGHRVTAELLDPANTRVHLPVVFHATLNTAAKVAYDPKNCADMSAAQPPVVTVQDALDFLCARKEDAADCCYSVGELDGVPGDFPTLKEALAALLDPQTQNPRAAVCLSLLPGQHVLEEALALESSKRAVLKFNGCNHAARLVVHAPVLFRRFASIVIRDLSIAFSDAGSFRFEQIKVLELSDCIIQGRGDAPSLLAFEQIGRARIANNLIHRASDKELVGNFGSGDKQLRHLVSTADEASYRAEAPKLLMKYEAMPIVERTAAAARMKTDIALLEKKLPAAELAAYLEFANTVGDPSRGALEERLETIRRLEQERLAAEHLDLNLDIAGPVKDSIDLPPPATAAPPATATPAPADPALPAAAPDPDGVALLFLDTDADLTLVDNHVRGEVRHLDDGDSKSKGPLTAAELKALDALARKGTFLVAPAKGRLRLRGNTLGRFAWGDAFADAVRAYLKDTKKPLELWADAHVTDNRFLSPDNTFSGHQLTLSGNHFAPGADEKNSALALVLARRAAFTANSADDTLQVRHYANASAEAANLGITFVPPL